LLLRRGDAEVVSSTRPAPRARPGNIFEPPRFVPAQTKVCFVNFCDTMTCGVDQGNNVSCLWDWTCTGTDLEETLGTSVPHDSITVAGYLAGLDVTTSWVIDVEAQLIDLFFWNGIGSTLPVQLNQPFTLNCADASARPSIIESSRF
jgi:hypothetical protein